MGRGVLHSHSSVRGAPPHLGKASRDPEEGLQRGRAHATLLSSSILRIRYGLLEEFSK